ncbi:MAG: polysaccharide biosynthesis protein [Clostridia bacterium]
MKKLSFLGGASILALSVIFAKVLGAIYRIPLTNILGAEGIGIYQFVYPVFALILTLSSGAVPSAISITVSKKASIGDEQGAKQDFAVALKVCLIIGLSGTLLLAALAYPICLVQSTDAFIGYLIVAPAVFIVTMISAFRGWFMGHKDMIPSSISQITEGIVKLGVGITLTIVLLPLGLPFAVAGALLGVVASELVTLIILWGIYMKQNKRLPRAKLKENKVQVKKLSRLAIPLILVGMILPLSQFIDSILLVNLMKWGGASQTSATQSYGIYAGTVAPLINLPVMICISIGVAITPQMVEGKLKKSIKFIMDKVTTATKMIFVICVPFVLIFAFMGENILGLLFPALGVQAIYLGSVILKIASINILALSIFQIYSAILQGLDKTYVPLKIMGVCVLIKTILSIALVPTIGIIGGAIGSAVGFSIAAISIMTYFSKYVKLCDGFAKNTSIIAISGVIMSLIIVLSTLVATNVYLIIATIIGSGLVYGFLLLVLNVFKREELASLPMSKWILKLNDKLHNSTE